MLLIDFYLNKIPAQNKEGYYFDDILSWNDYELETRHDYIQWVFPLKEKSRYNPDAPLLTEEEKVIFSTNVNVRKKIRQITTRMLFFYGFVFDKNGKLIRNSYSLKRKINGHKIGFTSAHNNLRITRMIKFLLDTNNEYLATNVFLATCMAMHESSRIKESFIKTHSMEYWWKLFPFLQSYTSQYDFQHLQVIEHQPKISNNTESNNTELNTRKSLVSADNRKNPVIEKLHKKEEIFPDEECPICMNDNVNYKLPCGHFFCKNCVDILFKRAQNNIYECPMCRKEFKIPKKKVVKDNRWKLMKMLGIY